MEVLRQYLKRKHGLAKQLANTLGVNPSTISQWHQVPAERVLDVERETGLSRYELRPDVFGPAPKKTRKAAA